MSRIWWTQVPSDTMETVETKITHSMDSMLLVSSYLHIVNKVVKRLLLPLSDLSKNDHASAVTAECVVWVKHCPMGATGYEANHDLLPT